jgi:chromosome segregation ATPase
MRPWIVSAVVVAIVAAGAIVFFDNGGEDGGNKTGGKRPVARQPAPAPLTESEVRKYLEVMPQLNEMLGRIAREYEERRRAGQADEAFGTYSQQRITELLAQCHVTREQFDRLRRRVEGVVDAIREEKQLEARREELDRKIAEKKRHLEMVKDEKTRELLENDIAEFKRQQEMPAPPIRPADRELVKSFWRDLEKAVPRTAPPLPREEGD